LEENTMYANVLRLTGSVFVIAAVALLTGCGAASPSVVPAVASSAADPAAQLTTAPTVDGFQDFAGGATTSGDATGANARLSEQQIQQLEDLQAQFQSGALTEAEVAEQAQAIIGDIAPDRAFAGFAFFGGPFGGRFQGERADLLNLTDEQRAQAQRIFQQLHDDIRTLRQNARDAILNVLTEEQRAQLRQIRENRPGLGHFVRQFARHHGRGARNHEDDNGIGASRTDMMPFPLLNRLAQRLILTDDQRTQIERILTDLRAAVRARHQAARDAFRAILTPDQLAILDNMENETGDTDDDAAPESDR